MADYGTKEAKREANIKRDPIMRYFDYAHLPEHLQNVSKHFAELADYVVCLPECEQRHTALVKLLEAKDAAVRASLG